MASERVYVGNLAYSVDDDELRDFMSQAGTVVSANVLRSRASYSRGCGIVAFSTVEEAQHAIDTLSNVELKNRPVFVRADREPPQDFSKPGNTTTRSSAAKPASNSAPSAPSVAPEPTTREQTSKEGQAAKDGEQRHAVFVSNLPFSVNWYELKELFSQVGPVVRADVRIGSNHRSKGRGIVQFETEEAVEAAIKQFNGYNLNGRPLEVRKDVPFSQRPAAFLMCSGYGEPSETVFVSNLPWSTTDSDLHDLFQSVGPLVRAQLQLFNESRPSGNAVVKFESAENAQLAVSQLNGYSYGTRELHVSYARYPPDIANA